MALQSILSAAEEGTLITPTSMPITAQGKQIGKMTLPAGTKVQVMRQEGAKTLIKTSLGETWADSASIATGQNPIPPPKTAGSLIKQPSPAIAQPKPLPPDATPLASAEDPLTLTYYQGGTPKLLAQVNTFLPEDKQIKSLDYLSGYNQCYSSAPFFTVFKDYLKFKENMTPAQKAQFEKDQWKISIRSEYDKYQVNLKSFRTGKNEKGQSLGHRPDYALLAVQSALELLWSQKLGHPIHLSADFLYWAAREASSQHFKQQFALNKDYPKQMKPLDEQSDLAFLVRGIRQFGICEDKYYTIARDSSGDDKYPTPSKDAIDDAAKRSQLVVRTLGIAKRAEPAPATDNCMADDAGNYPVIELLIHELQKKRPIYVEGRAFGPEDQDESNPDTYKKDPYMTAIGNERGHLVTGVATSDITNVNKYILEYRESWGDSAGDHGYFFSEAFHGGSGFCNAERYCSLSLD